MPSGALAKKLLLVSGLGLVVLLLVGAAVGAIGSAILPGDSFLSKPEIHLPPQPIFPAGIRNQQLGLPSQEGHEAEAHIEPLSIIKFSVTNTQDWTSS